MKVGLLTSGGDCAGLNPVMRGFGKAIYSLIPDVEIFGITDGYTGLINGEYIKMEKSQFSGILNRGGTILGTSRQPYKKVIQVNENDKLASMKETYRKMGLDVLITLGGNGTHKTAALLYSEGLNIIGLPKTIDNDIFGTDVTFGFHSAVDVATDCIDRIQTTAASHRRTIVVEVMGNKCGWLTLYAGIGGGADIILIPEIPFDIDKIIAKVEACTDRPKGFCVIAAAEGVMDIAEAKMSKKERNQLRLERNETTASNRIAKAIADKLEVETRVVVPGHIQRGGNPSPYDRVLCSQIGAYAARLVYDGCFGVTPAYVNGRLTYNSLTDIAGKAKLVPTNHELIQAARDIGISFGD